MSIELYFGNHLETLAERLTDEFRVECRTKSDIFAPSLLFVPNANLKKWLQLRLAKKNGVVMNVEFQFLETGLWRLLEFLDERPGESAFLDMKQRRIALLGVLENLDPSDGVFAPVLDYLKASGGAEKSPDREKRLWQLSERFSALFGDYEFHREEMVREWLDPGFATDDEMIRCQRGLYLEAGKLRESMREDGKRWLSLMEYSDEVLSRLRKSASLEARTRFVHLFGFSGISAFHLSLIERLARFYNFVFYSINPCREFWEDVKTPWEEKSWNKRAGVKKLRIDPEDVDRGELSSEDSNPLLSLWGKPGRESIRTLCQLTNFDFHEFYDLRENEDTVLKKIQNSVLTFKSPGEASDRIGQDVSLQIYGCPSRFREVETVYNSILYNLQKDKNLKMTDISVQVPDISAYKPVIDAVFNRKPRTISYNLADARAEIESLYGKGIMDLLELASGRFSRPEVFKLLLNPCLMQKWGIAADGVGTFGAWAEALNVFHTFDREDKRKSGYGDSDLFTWKQGLCRMKLARVMSDPCEAATVAGDGGGPPVDLNFAGKVPYSDAESGDQELLETFCAIMEKLHEIARLFNRGPFSGKEWKRHILYACDELFEIPPTLKSETTVQKSFFEALDDLLLYDRLGKTDAAREMDLPLFKEFVKSGLSDIWGGYGDYLTSGVTVSALTPMRPIPFSIVYVLGMEEGAFPGRPDRSSLDLRLCKRKIGDISIPERNCYLFLELLLSVREKLYVSYVARDLQKDRDLQPCSVLNQLRRYAENEILPEGRKFDIVQIPLKPSSKRYAAPGNIDGHSDVLVNYSMADRLAYYRESGLWPKARERMSEKQRDSVQFLMPDFSFDVSTNSQAEYPLEDIAARQLRYFLENPVRQSIRRHLGLYDETDDVEDVMAAEDEPFYGRFPADYRLGVETLGIWIDRAIAGEPEEKWDGLLAGLCKGVYNRFRMESLTPEGVYGELDFDKVLADIVKRAEILKPFLKNACFSDGAFHALCAGEPMEHPAVPLRKCRILKVPPASMTLEVSDARGNPVARPVRFHGRIPRLWKERDGAWHCLLLTGSGKKGKPGPCRHLLESALSYLLLRGSGDGRNPIGDAPVLFHVAYKEHVRSWSFQVGSNEAKAYVETLAKQYLDPRLRAWLPYEIVVKAAEKNGGLLQDDPSGRNERNFRLELLEALENSDDSLVCLAKPEIPLDALQKARERFAIFVENMKKAD